MTRKRTLFALAALTVTTLLPIEQGHAFTLATDDPTTRSAW